MQEVVWKISSFFKLMNNAVFEKNTKNMRNDRDI